jgi:RNA polymerase sigma factor (sigma-70 family)
MNNQDLHIWSYYHKTLKLAIKFIGCDETAKDITSDALTNVIIMCRSEAPPDIMHDPFPYICTSLRNLVLNIKKREKVKIEFSDLDFIDFPVDRLETEDFYRVLSKCPPSLIRITKTKLDGLSTREGADELNINESAYKTQWHRAKKELKKKFEYMIS